MRLRANPNRMELLRLRRRLILAERGHKLLKDKLDELMRSFLEAMRELMEIKDEVDLKIEKVSKISALVRSRHWIQELERAVEPGEISIISRQERILNLAIPAFKLEKIHFASSAPWLTEAELEVGKRACQELWPLWLKMAELWRRSELLAEEIEITRRRVNALEHILIPSIRETINYIAARLEEIERSYKTQLMRIKEIIERH